MRHSKSKLRQPGRGGYGGALTPIAAALMIGTLAPQASAFQFNTGDDLDVRWDNTVKLNYMIRAEDQDDDILRQGENAATGILADDADLGWDQWDTVSTRVDLLSEMDVVWKDKMGFRVSGAGWYDFAYADDSNAPKCTATAQGGPCLNTWGGLSVKPGEFTNEAEDFHKVGGEVLDAFVFYNFNIGDDVSGNIRAGRHTIFWGNSLQLTGAVHGIAGSMVTIDAAKAFGVPGIEAQEVFLPTNKISTVLQLTPNLTLNGYYSLEWEGYRLPEYGTYFSPAEILTDKSEFLMFAPGFGAPGDAGFRPRIGQKKVSNAEPDDTGEWGANVQYYFNDWDFEAQVFYLNYHDKNFNGLMGTLDVPAAVATFGAAGVAPFDSLYPTFAGPPEALTADALGIGEFKWGYKEDNKAFGFALSKEWAGISLGFEYVRREDSGLRPDLGASIQNLTNVPAPLAPVLGEGKDIDKFSSSNYEYGAAVGDTNHIIINGVGLLNGTPLWDGGSYVVEAVFSSLDKVTDGEQYLLSTLETDEWSYALGIAFNPEYYQVFPGVDLKIPMSVSYTFNEEPAITLGGNPKVGNGSIGAEFNVDQTWFFTAKYNVFFGEVDTGIAGLIGDRDNISLTLKRTF